MTRYEIAEVKKAVICAVAFAAELVNEGLLDGTAATYVRIAVAVLGTYGVFQFKNKPLRK